MGFKMPMRVQQIEAFVSRGAANRFRLVSDGSRRLACRGRLFVAFYAGFSLRRK
jgi:hypothetical protein